MCVCAQSTCQCCFLPPDATRVSFAGQLRISLGSWSMRKVWYHPEEDCRGMLHIGPNCCTALLSPGLVRSLKIEVGQLTGVKASLEREVEKLRAEVRVFLFPFSFFHLTTKLSSPHRTRICRGSWKNSRMSWQPRQGTWNRLSKLCVCVCVHVTVCVCVVCVNTLINLLSKKITVESGDGLVTVT